MAIVTVLQTHSRMAQFSNFLGRRVHLEYRAGATSVPASGVLVADSGRSVFLEEHFTRKNGVKQFRWEIPYPCIIHMEDDAPLVDASAAD